MRNLIIIGNGFDKAHNLETSYNEFIEDLFKKYFKDKKKYEKFLKPPPASIKNYNDLRKDIRENNYRLKFNNTFIEALLKDIVNYNWCDIEYKYRVYEKYKKASV